MKIGFRNKRYPVFFGVVVGNRIGFYKCLFKLRRKTDTLPSWWYIWAPTCQCLVTRQSSEIRSYMHIINYDERVLVHTCSISHVAVSSLVFKMASETYSWVSSICVFWHSGTIFSDQVSSKFSRVNERIKCLKRVKFNQRKNINESC